MHIAFYKGRSRVFDRVVQWWTRSPYSHCELVFDLREMGSAYGHCASSSWVDGGVRTRWIRLDPAKWDIVPITWAGADPSYARQWFIEHNAQPYDVIGLLGFVLSPVRERRSRWFCSEACAAALRLTDPWRYSPGALAALVRSLH